MVRRASASLALSLVLASALPAQAEFDPLAPEDLPRLVQRRARLYPTRPCAGRGPGQALRLYPGDVVTAAALHSLGIGSPPSPTLIEVEAAGGRQVLHIEDLSKRPLDYSWRGKQGFDSFWTGLAVDAARLMDQYQRIVSRAGDRLPAYDQAQKKMSEDWHRLQHLRRQLDFLRSQLFDRAYHKGDERRLIVKEKEWLPAKGEAFITEYSGALSPEKRKRMQSVYLVMNALANVPSLCSRIAQLRETIDQPSSGRKYEGLEPAHRARLQAEDIAKTHTAITELKAKLVVTLSEARAGLLAAGIKAR
jgi:hypothetical protein